MTYLSNADPRKLIAKANRNMTRPQARQKAWGGPSGWAEFISTESGWGLKQATAGGGEKPSGGYRQRRRQR
jgi:hypothetical protein